MKHPFRQFQYPTSPEQPTAEDRTKAIDLLVVDE
jgi:hypothetical protein